MEAVGTFRVVSPGGTTISRIFLTESITLGNVKEQITKDSEIAGPVLLVERDGVLHRITQEDSTLISKLNIGETVIVHSQKTIVELNNSKLIMDDNKAEVIHRQVAAEVMKKAINGPNEISQQVVAPGLDAALKSEQNSAITRGILYICKCQNNTIEIVENSLAKTLIPDGGFSGAMSVGFLSLANEDSVPATKAEVTVLFTMLSQKFEGKDKLSIRVDYGPEGGPVTDVLQEWFELIKDQRKREAELTGEKVKTLPMGWGLPCKSSLYVENGCAKQNSNIIDDHGTVMKKNPHEIAYMSEKQEDIDKAFHLQPDRPSDWDNKFTNRDIARAMGYTFEKDAIRMCNTENFGVLSYLLELYNGNLKIGFNILKSICGYGKPKHVSTVMTLFEKGLPIFDPNERYISSDDPIFKLFESLDKYDLEKLLELISKPENISIYSLDKIKSSFCWSVTIRYTKKEYDAAEFRKLIRFWYNLHLQEDPNLYKIDESQKNSWGLEVCKGVIELAEDRRFTFRSNKCKEKILEIIKEIEKSKKVKEFDNVFSEVKNFPSYYSGYSSYELKRYAQPISKRLLETYSSLSEAEKVEYKQKYEDAIRFLDNCVKNAGKGFF